MVLTPPTSNEPAGASVQKFYWFKKNKRIWWPLGMLSIFVVALIMIIAGFVFPFLWPVPQLAGVAWLAWCFRRKLKGGWLRPLKSLLLSTAMGLTIVFALQLYLNIRVNYGETELADWMRDVDDVFIVWSGALGVWTEMWFVYYLLIVATVVVLDRLNSKKKIYQRFGWLEGFIGTTANTLIVVTSVTFFSPVAIDHSLDHIYKKFYGIAIREIDKNERMSLLLKQMLEKAHMENDEEYDGNRSTFSEHLESLFNELRYTTAGNYTVQADAVNDANAFGQEQGEKEDVQQRRKKEQEQKQKKANADWAKMSNTPQWEERRFDFTQSAMSRAQQASDRQQTLMDALTTVLARGLTVEPQTLDVIKTYIATFTETIVLFVTETKSYKQIVNWIFDVKRLSSYQDLFGEVARYFAANKRRTSFAQRNTDVKWPQPDGVKSELASKVDAITTGKRYRGFIQHNMWESFRYKIYRNIQSESCPYILAEREVFSAELAEWIIYLDQHQPSTVAQQEQLFVDYVTEKTKLMEVFLRALLDNFGSLGMPYHPKTLIDVLEIYHQHNPDIRFDKQKFQTEFSAKPACL